MLLTCFIYSNLYLFIPLLLLHHHILTNYFMTPWPVVLQAHPSMEFSKQEYWSGLPLPSLGDIPCPGIKLLVLYERWILYHWATREAPLIPLYLMGSSPSLFLLANLRFFLFMWIISICIIFIQLYYFLDLSYKWYQIVFVFV